MIRMIILAALLTACDAQLVRIDEACSKQSMTKDEYRDCLQNGIQRIKHREPSRQPTWVDYFFSSETD